MKRLLILISLFPCLCYGQLRVLVTTNTSPSTLLPQHASRHNVGGTDALTFPTMTNNAGTSITVAQTNENAALADDEVPTTGMMGRYVAANSGGGDVFAASNNVFTGATNRFTGWVSLGTNLTKSAAGERLFVNGDMAFKKFYAIDTATGAVQTNSWISFTSGKWIFRENGTNATLGL